MTEQRNPYEAPRAATVAATPAAGAGDMVRLRAEPLTLPAAAGSAWIGGGWELFKKDPGVLVLLTVVYFAVGMAAQLVPLFGSLFMMLTGQVWIAGLVIASDKLARDEAIGVGDLFAGFSHPRLGRLIGLSVLGLALGIGMVLVLAVPVIFTVGSALLTSSPDPAAIMSQMTLTGILVTLLLFVVLVFFLIAYLMYAPALLTLHDIGVFDACTLSLRGVLRNWASLTVFGLVIGALMLATIFTLFLGMLVVWPMMMIALYLSYRGIFTESVPASA